MTKLVAAIDSNIANFTKIFNLKLEIHIFFAYFLDCILQKKCVNIAKENLYEKVKLDCSDKHQNYLHSTCNSKEFNWTLVGLHFILFERLCSLHYLFSERRELLSKSKNLILAISHCLNVKNYKYLTFLSRNSCIEYFEIERHILKSYLKKEIKGMCLGLP